MAIFGKKKMNQMIDRCVSYCRKNDIEYHLDENSMMLFVDYIHNMAREKLAIVFQFGKNGIFAFTKISVDNKKDYENLIRELSADKTVFRPYVVQFENDGVFLTRDIAVREIDERMIDGILNDTRNSYINGIDALSGSVLDTPVKYEGESRIAENGKYVAFGHGTMYYSSGGRHEGEWTDGIKNGRGTEHYPKGGYCETTWQDGMRSGFGICHYRDGSRAEGNYEYGALNGEVTLTVEYPDLFKEATGGEYSKDEVFFKGNYINGAIKGFGRLNTPHLGKGSYIDGEWDTLDDCIGYYYNPEGERIKIRMVDGEIKKI